MKGQSPVTNPNHGYGWNDKNPFRDPYPERKYIIMGNEYDKDGSTGSYVNYVDHSSHFELTTMNAGNAEVDFRDMKKKVVEDESDEFVGQSPRRYNPWHRIKPSEEHDWLQNHYFDNHEIFQWLFLTGGLIRTGPEQIWIERHHYNGCADDRGSVSPGQREAVSSFRLTAGSIQMGYSGKYCCDGAQVGGFQQLAILFPGMWKWPSISLGDFEFYKVSDVPPEAPEPWHEIATKPIQSHFNPPDSFDTLQQWLSECKSDHSHCQAENAAQHFRPLRLIHVGTPRGSQEPYLHIVHEGQILSYATLSYCHGSFETDERPIITLSSTNLVSMQTQIKHIELAKSFQDAISITRALSIPYLWIDALCVIQDSPQDRAWEASRKVQYFANAELNIAATASPHAHHGILTPREIARNSVELTGDAAGIGVRPIAEDVFGLIRNMRWFPTRPPLSAQPLTQQSHALLERMSAKRTVHFTDQQMIWQCQTCLIGEDGQIGEDQDRFSQLCSNRPFDIHLREPMREITGANENEHHRDPDTALATPVKGYTGVKYSLDEALIDTSWYDLIEEYTKRSIHEPRDFLPLLSPFAQKIQWQTEGSYLAGLWAMEGQIPFRSLLWYCKNGGAAAHNGSPSWAWSSVVGAVTHPCQYMHRMDHPGARSEWIPPKTQRQRHVLSYPCRNSQIKVLSSKTTPSTDNLLGQVEGGRLEITGLLHNFTGAEEWDFAAERGYSRKDTTRLRSDQLEGHVTGSRKIFYTNAYTAVKSSDEANPEGSEENIEEERREEDDEEKDKHNDEDSKEDENEADDDIHDDGHDTDEDDNTDAQDDASATKDEAETSNTVPNSKSTTPKLLNDDHTFGDRSFTLTLHLDHLSPSSSTTTTMDTPIDWHTTPHLLLLVAEFRDELDSMQRPHITPSDGIWFIILRQRVGGEAESEGEASSKEEAKEGDDGENEEYERIGVAVLRRKSKDTGWGGKGLWGVHSAYEERNGWVRRRVVVV
ncbi:MAG: hypothetical protein Q9222_002631 [Ikaeria aurantiellina]